MKFILPTIFSLAVCAPLFFAAAASSDQNAAGTIDFENCEPGSVPEDLLVLAGDFVVTDLEGNRCLKLPGAPLEAFGLLFGPQITPRPGTPIEASARFRGAPSGRRYPVFGVGICGVGGYRLQLAPAKRALELLSNERLVAKIPYRWKTDSWTHLRIRLVHQEGGWIVQGKAWSAEGEEPADWLIKFEDEEGPIPGRSSVWGMPYSGEPIYFDDLR